MDETTTVETTESTETEATTSPLAYVAVGAAATAVGFLAYRFVKAWKCAKAEDTTVVEGEVVEPKTA